MFLRLISDAHLNPEISDNLWLAHPSVRRYRNRQITGEPETHPLDYFRMKYAERVPFRSALVVGCGTGTIERQAHAHAICHKFDCFDVSDEALGSARALSLPEAAQFNYFQADGNRVRLSPRRYDLVICFHSLHHIRDLEHLLGQIQESLTDDGLLYVDEFVGPSRWQWADAQLAAANSELARLPERLRVCNWPMPIPKLIYFLATGQYAYRPSLRALVKIRTIRPSLALMRLNDSSESVRSKEIPELVRRKFRVVEESPYGGTLLNLVLSKIICNFRPEDPEGSRVLDALIERERELLSDGVLEHDHIFMIAERDPTAEER